MDINGSTCGRVSQSAKLVTPSNSKYKPFVEFWIESPRIGTAYTDRVRCVIYTGSKSPNDYIANITAGKVIHVIGEVKAEAYESTATPGKWYGGLKMIVRHHDFLGGPEWAGSVRGGSNPTRSEAVPAAAPAADTGTDDVAF